MDSADIDKEKWLKIDTDQEKLPKIDTDNELGYPHIFGENQLFV